MDYPGDKRFFPARSFADDIPESNRRGGSVMECDYGFIFLSNAAEYFEYFRLRAENRKKDAAKHLNQCLMNREAMKRENITERQADVAAEQPKQEDALTRALHGVVDAIARDERFGFLTEEDIDRAVSVIKSIADTRITYEQAAAELGCTVPALHTRVCRSRIKTEHVVFLRRRDVEQLKGCKDRSKDK